MTEEEKKKLRAEEERYKIQRNASDTFTKNFFVLPIITGTLTFIMLRYSIEKCYNFAAFILFISLALATFSVWRYMKLAMEIARSPSLDTKREIDRINAIARNCFNCFTISICVLFVGIYLFMLRI